MHKNPIAIVYDWMDKWGGVERILTELLEMYPSAHFYTSAVNYDTAPWAKQFHPSTTFIQSLPASLRGDRTFLIPMYPAAFESLSFREYKTVISLTSSFAKSIITYPGTFHLCYLLTPTRFLWSHEKEYLNNWRSLIGASLIHHMKRWDLIAARRPDKILSISTTVQDRCLRFYQRNSNVLYPPFDTKHWNNSILTMQKPTKVSYPKKYFLFVGRMERYKMPELIVETAKRTPNSEFVFVGTGSILPRLKNRSPKNCHFLDFVSDFELSYLYSHAEALIFPQVEDFGYVSLEAQYHGCPVIAYYSGGAVETVLEDKTGLFFTDQTPLALAAVLERYSKISYNLKHSTKSTKKVIEEKFGVSRFRKDFFYQLDNPNI